MKEKIRRELIFSKLKELKNSVYFIKEYLPSDVKHLEDRGERNKLYKEVEFAIQLVIDIYSIINSDTSKTIPADEDSIFASLEKEKIISHDFAEKLSQMKGFRNLLVHRYGEVDDNIAYESIVSGLRNFEMIINGIEGFLRKHEGK